MRYIRSLAPVTVVLALTIILAACTQAASPTPSPSASPDQAPTDQPAPSDSPSDEPEATPSPSEPAVIEHDLAMIGRVTEDGVEVRTEPSLDAPILTGESFTDPGTTPEIVLDEGDLALVTLGPVLAEGESWYEVASVDGSDAAFAFGWVPGRLLEREGDVPEGFTDVIDINGQGEGGSVTADVLLGTPVSVRFAAVPMPDADECDIDINVTNTDGSAANIVTDTIDEGEVAIGEFGPFEMPSLFQNEAGTVTLDVETDCSFAATMIAP
jgi:hypothetical protein